MRLKIFALDRLRRRSALLWHNQHDAQNLDRHSGGRIDRLGTPGSAAPGLPCSGIAAPVRLPNRAPTVRSCAEPGRAGLTVSKHHQGSAQTGSVPLVSDIARLCHHKGVFGASASGAPQPAGLGDASRRRVPFRTRFSATRRLLLRMKAGRHHRRRREANSVIRRGFTTRAIGARIAWEQIRPDRACTARLPRRRATSDAATAIAARPTRVVAAGPTRRMRAMRTEASRARATAAWAIAHPRALTALFQQVDEASGVGARIARRGHHRIVAGHLALQRKARIDPPHRRMEKQDCANRLLQQVGPVVMPAQMRELMDQHRPEFGRASDRAASTKAAQSPGLRNPRAAGTRAFSETSRRTGRWFSAINSRSAGSSIRHRNLTYSCGESAAPARPRRPRGPVPQPLSQSRARRKPPPRRQGRVISG